MWYEIYKFEIAYRLKSVETYVFFASVFIFSLAGVEFVFEGVELGDVKLNAPIVIAKAMAAITGFLMLMVSLIMGVPIIRDVKFDFQFILFNYPIRKWDYLVGRFLGSFTILLFVFLGLLFGMMLGELMPWRHPDDLLNFNALPYFNAFANVVLPILFASAALFFVSGALIQNMMVVYTQGIFFFVLFMLTQAISNEAIQAVVDPLSLSTLTKISEPWLAAEHNQFLIPMKGLMLMNKSLWVMIGGLSLWIGYRRFDFNLNKGEGNEKEKDTQPRVSFIDSSIKIPTFLFDVKKISHLSQVGSLSKFYFLSTVRQTSFWSIIFCAFIIILINGINLGTVYGVDSYSRTYLIIEELQEMGTYFFLMVLIFYSGEIIWKERDADLDLISDSTIVSSFTLLLGKLIALALIYVVMLLALIGFGVFYQVALGYYVFDFGVYFSGMFLSLFPFLLFYTFAAFFIQVLCNRKFVGFILVLLFFVATILLQGLGFTHELFAFGGSPLGIYSEMNGYGQSIAFYILVKLYWLVFGFILLMGASIFLERGKEKKLSIRRMLGVQRMSSRGKRGGVSLMLIFVVLGGFIFYNTNVLNEYWSSQKKQDFRAAYEKALKPIEYKIQPIITDVNLQVELLTDDEKYWIQGTYLITNQEEEPIKKIHVQKYLNSQVKLDSVQFNRSLSLNKEYETFGHYIYSLDQALSKDDTIKMTFRQRYVTKGWEGSTSQTGLFDNGTFLSNKELPSFGYNKKYEIKEDRTRAAYQLKPRKSIAKVSNKYELNKSRNGSDAQLINFEIVIGTPNDQTAIAAGNLLKKWKEKNRNYFHYKMKEPMIDFYSIHSARYEVLLDQWSNGTSKDSVDLEIYYHQGHGYNVERMIKAMKISLAYYSENFSPYPYDQLRIVEFPRYAAFAQSLPATIPFSESMGFLFNIDDEKEVDMVSFITAHEVAHQWWGMQLEAANVEGQNLILETLAQYLALMVMKQNDPKEKIQQLLKMEMEDYLKARKKNAEKELPLAEVGNEDYIYYEKGVINMFALQTYIGEEKVNLALRKFLENWKSIDGKTKSELNRYAISKDLLNTFKELTPDSLQFVITDLFETVTYYDNKIERVSSEEKTAGTYELNVQIRFDKSSTGEIDFSVPQEYLDVEVLGANGQPIYFEKHLMREGANEFAITLDDEPSKVIIDPLFKMIDLNFEDNNEAL